MLSTIQPLPVGNALRLFVQPPAGATVWRILRKPADDFNHFDDATAVVAYEGDELVLIDAQGLVNGQVAYYRPFYTADGQVWTPGPTASGTPAATYEELTADVPSFLRERLQDGLAAEYARGNFQSDLGYIQVYTAPPSMEQDLRFPLVTIDLEDEHDDERFIGEDLAQDHFDAIEGEWSESEGWLAAVAVTVIGWSLNSDERNELRKAIRRLVIANLPVFADKGWTGVSIKQHDVNSLNGEFGINMYQVVSTFTCMAPVRVAGRVSTVADVQVTARSV